jgi:molybdate transport system substrate-binding protein
MLRRSLLGVLAALCLPAVGLAAGKRTEITVFAAASLTEVVTELAALYSAAAGVTVRPSFAATSVLARQIEAGAAAEAFLSADAEWMDYLDERNLLEPGSRSRLLGNVLVLIAPAGRDVSVRLDPGGSLPAALGGGRLAVADPDLVPAGRYARSALQSIGAWEAVRSQLVPAENVRVALAFVARGEAALGIVYATDARVEPRVAVIATFPATSHAPIVYPAALLRGASPAARDFFRYLHGPEARAVFAAAGFKEPANP